MQKLKAAEARAVQKANPYDTWAARDPKVNAQATLNASNRLWNAKLPVGISPKFTFPMDAKVFAMGSCFAREVEDALVEQGFEVPTYCDPLFAHPLLKHPDQENLKQRPRAFLNRYNSMSLQLEIRNLLGIDDQIDKGGLIYKINEQHSADLHYSQALPQTTFDLSLERRKVLKDYLSGAIQQCSVFVFTLGLAEAWFDSKAGCYLNNTPGPRVVAAYQDQLEIHLTEFSQHLRALEETYDSLAGKLGDGFKVIITVSPVPLEKTFFGQDVISVNTYSKSMLRAVAHEFANNHANVDYFPSYEIVSYSAQNEAWAWDRRHVLPDLVSHIMQTFRSHYIE